MYLAFFFMAHENGVTPACRRAMPGAQQALRKPFPPPRDLPDPGIKPLSLTSPALAIWFFTTNAPERMKGWSQSKNNTQLWM